MDPNLVVYAVPVALVSLALAFVVGRRTGNQAIRIRELEAEVDRVLSEQERAAAEADVLRDELAAARGEHEKYRVDVVDHFSGTSDLLRDLTVQYRAVYEHLTKGASVLCPEGFVGLTEGLPTPELPDAAGDAPSADAPEPRIDRSASADPDAETRPLA